MQPIRAGLVGKCIVRAVRDGRRALGAAFPGNSLRPVMAAQVTTSTIIKRWSVIRFPLNLSRA
jgi:hypothetical protein